jgi:metallophosphoesterase superfamily enzyme
MILPSFGAYTGGLDVGEGAIASLFGPRFHAYMLGTDRVYAIPRIQAGRRNTREEIQPIISAMTTAARP